MKYQLRVLRWSALVILYSTMGGLLLVMIIEALLGPGTEVSVNPGEAYQITTDGFFIILFSQIVGLALALVFGEPPRKSE